MQKKNSILTVKKLVAGGTALAALAAPAISHAQSYPNKPLRFISHLGAGGPPDVYWRILCEGISQALGQPVITENRVGANGNIALEATSKAAPDGYTIGSGAAAQLVTGPLIQPAPFDPVKSFTHMGVVFEVPFVLYATAGSNISSVQQLTTVARANPRKLNYPSIGVGSVMHLAGEWLNVMQNFEIVHIPYKTDIDMNQAIRSSEVQVGTHALGIALQMRQQSGVKLLALLSSARSPDAPDVPTAAEAGIPNYTFGSWGSVLGPAGVPREITQRINRAMVAHMQKPEVAAKAAATNLNPKVGSPEENVALLTKSIDTWKDVIVKAKLKF